MHRGHRRLTQQPGARVRCHSAGHTRGLTLYEIYILSSNENGTNTMRSVTSLTFDLTSDQ
ncbi:hypothetical protein EYF80_053210 [Liparis tanakae]|uniref:Uncharacterized protein n=1 Tax=Liparis tanakae TaxID=230148 RepID=A0A4Z2F8K5_9TELE|nr:hypothetical protein EYF80_053210 [Liparis tanakae]